jgi:processing peptidase subunit alpha
MYSRLYTHILNHYPQIDHCASFHHIYADSSLFGLFATFFPKGEQANTGNSPEQIFPHLVHQLSLLLYSPLATQELSRAKNQLKSSLVMALESRSVEVEDLGRQVCQPYNRISTLSDPVCTAPCPQPQDPRVRNVRQDRRSDPRVASPCRYSRLWA